MSNNSLASSRKAWRVIQSLIGRVMYGNRYNELGGGDFIKLPTIPSEDHPFKVSRSGNTIRFSKGLVQVAYGTDSWEVDDAGGYVYTPGTPVYLYLVVGMGFGVPIQVTNSIYTYVALPIEPFIDTVITDPSDIDAPFRKYFAATTLAADTFSVTFVPPDTADAEVKIPICYISDTKTVQLLTGNVSLFQIAAHRNLYLWPCSPKRLFASGPRF